MFRSSMRYATPAAAGLFIVTLAMSVGAQRLDARRAAPGSVEAQRGTPAAESRPAAEGRPATQGRPAQPRPATTQSPPTTGTSSGTDPREATARKLCTQCHPFENV